MNFRYKHVILGGTFDYLHAGHKRFIDSACENASKITIGLTTKKLLEKKIHKDVIQSYKVRKKALENYLKIRGFFDKTSIIPLSDIIGAGFEKDVDAIFAIDESFNNAQFINDERIKQKLPKAKIIIVPMLKASDGGLISSKRIRGGEIDRNGYNYLSLFQTNIQVPDYLRTKLRKPFGKIVKTIEDYKKISSPNGLILAIGDIVVSNLMRTDAQANISIFDFKTHRIPITDQTVLKYLPNPDIKIENKPSTIDRDAVSTLNLILRKSINLKGKYAIEVNGEEDLLALSAIILSPLGSIVLYGIRDLGAVAVKVTESRKNQVKKILEKFRSI